MEIAGNLVSIAESANFVYIRQKGEPRGNARPILNAAHLIGDEPFFFFFADDFFTGKASTASQMLSAYQKTGKAVVALRRVPDEEVSSYGIAALKGKSNSRLHELSGIIEKPELSDAPSNLAVGSGYLLTPESINILEKQKPGDDGEIRISDTIETLALTDTIYGLEIEGEYHDTGNPVAYLKTLLDVTLKDPKYGELLKEYLKTVL